MDLGGEKESVMAKIMEGILIKHLLNQGAINQSDIELLTKNVDKYLTVPLALVTEQVMTCDQLRQWNCALFDIEVFELSTFDFNSWQFKHHSLLKEQSAFLQEHQILPISIHNQVVTLATAEPSNLTVQTTFEFNSGFHTELVYCDPILLQQKLNELLTGKVHTLSESQSVQHQVPPTTAYQVSQTQSPATSNINHVTTHKEEKHAGQSSNTLNEPTEPIIGYVDKILRQAIKQGASDLHFEPYEHSYRIRFRVDGVLHNKGKPPESLNSRLAARIKVMANMDIAEKRKPQDGRLKFTFDKQHVEFRVSTLPTIWGEKVVLRILDTQGNLANVKALGFDKYQEQTYLTALSQPQGLILVTGPTGSGKTLTLYSGLNVLNTEDINISTIEDPVEYHLQGINQVQVNGKAKLDFANSLRAFLRQDPDVVMVGEIRDLETAEIAIKAAHTGHLVLSTLHTNSAAETLNRLTNMGIPTYNLASAISLIIAQRLVRCLCDYCKQPETDIPIKELVKQGFDITQLNAITLYKAKGCKRCNQGYKGRTSIVELLKPNANVRQLIMQQANVLTIQTEAVNGGMVSLRQAGLNKVIKGVTSLEEINRVISY
mgnify:FL=1